MLTTQYLEEADQLADRIIVIDGGKVIAEGTAAELKAKVGNDRLELTFEDAASLAKAAELSADHGSVKRTGETTAVHREITDVGATSPTLSTACVAPASPSPMAVHKPTLDDVFLTLTGKTHATENADQSKPDPCQART